MKLQMMSWIEVEAHLNHSDGIIIPVGSTEQHGPIGLIGTDALCAEVIADKAAEMAGAIVAPVLALTPAPFNMAFPGTISVSEPLFRALVGEVIVGLAGQGFRKFYFLNAHGANLDPLRQVGGTAANVAIRIRNWWDFDPVTQLRRDLYGNWEGMHATPSEVAITQALFRTVPMHPLANSPPQKLSADAMRALSGDHHGPPDQHRAAFPDGRVGSHSALARPDHGHRLLAVAAAAVASDASRFFSSRADA